MISFISILMQVFQRPCERYVKVFTPTRHVIDLFIKEAVQLRFLGSRQRNPIDQFLEGLRQRALACKRKCVVPNLLLKIVVL